MTTRYLPDLWGAPLAHCSHCRKLRAAHTPRELQLCAERSPLLSCFRCKGAGVVTTWRHGKAGTPRPCRRCKGAGFVGYVEVQP